MTAEAELMVVTGAASGIGRAVTVAAMRRGNQVVALDVTDDTGTSLARETGAVYLHCDVSDPQDWENASRKIQALGVPRFVHLNAGIQIAPPQAPLQDYRFDSMQIERYRRMMGVNVDGVVFGLKSLLPLMSNGGAVVVTGSLAGITPYAVDPLYAMSKHAVSGLVRSLARELSEQNIVINAICPGAIDTAIIPQDQRAGDIAFMTPEHIADEVMYLMDVTETGKTWAKVAQDKPVFIVRAPGDKQK